jgi:hypothetical protein
VKTMDAEINIKRRKKINETNTNSKEILGKSPMNRQTLILINKIK